MKIQIMLHSSIMRPVLRFFLGASLVMAAVTFSLIPFASSTGGGGELQDDRRVWGAALARGNFGYVSPDLTRWLWWMEGQLRNRDCCSPDIALDQSLIRPGLGYALTDQSTVWLGYAHAWNELPDNTDIQEDRIWEQYMWSGKTPLGAFTFRPRLEQRWQPTAAIPARASVNFSNSPGRSLFFKAQISWCGMRCSSICMIRTGGQGSKRTWGSIKTAALSGSDIASVRRSRRKSVI